MAPRNNNKENYLYIYFKLREVLRNIDSIITRIDELTFYIQWTPIQHGDAFRLSFSSCHMNPCYMSHIGHTYMNYIWKHIFIKDAYYKKYKMKITAKYFLFHFEINIKIKNVILFICIYEHNFLCYTNTCYLKVLRVYVCTYIGHIYIYMMYGCL